jgi:hypothetical protein
MSADYILDKTMIIKQYLTLLIILCCSVVYSDDKSMASECIECYPSTVTAYPDHVYWGDTHVHTNLSTDAYNYGNRLSPETAYLFAKGETVRSTNGLMAKLRRPLDFLVIADHSTNMGLMQGLQSFDQQLLESPKLHAFAKRLKSIEELAKTDLAAAAKQSFQFVFDVISAREPIVDKSYQYAIWNRVTSLADIHNDPGHFTTFIGYEWTLKDLSVSAGLHRVVVFKDGSEKAQQLLPYTEDHNRDMEKFWGYLASYEETTGGEVIAIPHNSNLSNGLMFAIEDEAGKSLSHGYAKARSRWEPLVEVTQMKGDSETHPILSPTDEFAGFEKMIFPADSPDTGRPYEYARSALKLGLRQQAKLGINPFKFGLIGSTDSHTSLATADENNYYGKFAWLEPYPGRVEGSWFGRMQPNDQSKDSAWGMKAYSLSASGYTGIWAQDNTRESLFAAMKRKEVYASTGPRIKVRFFGGWNYQRNDAFSPDLARIGYEKGVPMGSDITSAPKGKAPTFLIRAVKDPEGANLDRLQVIKGWHDAKGELHEKIYNVALSDNRKDKGTKTKPVGNSVDVADASYTNTIGDPELAIVWQDPDFNPNELAFYYLRVLEIPTPRWTAYDAKQFGLKKLPEEIPMITQERAYSSPIWYTPSVIQNRKWGE